MFIREARSNREARAGAKVLKKNGVVEATMKLLKNGNFKVAVNINNQVIGVIDVKKNAFYATKESVLREIEERFSTKTF